MRHLIFTRTLCFVLVSRIVWLTACGPNTSAADKTEKTALVAAAVPEVPKAPDEVFGALFEAVQMNRIFPDGKTFADIPFKMDLAGPMGSC